MNRITKNFFHPGTYTNKISLVLLTLRLVVGIFMLTHGLGKFERMFGDAPIQFADPLGVGATASLALIVFSEVFCSILIIIGLGTRLAAIPLFITMLVAALIVHSTDGFGRQELPLMYAAIYTTIAVLGAGKYSLDYLIAGRRKH
ncbi:DoxX family protein [Hwangdonia lutea]|uniref:DoxX family protein n=1 Tax=Hwangdonia lutea TaxID=3075823 RepID=A0AA97HPI5_9FLAO|nr:DoxX family protein [Hwangdonia sp. SCSIO 19198]WOD42677.1 DoxX family protein [Hwangdonia sp. SCSIO 19198]